MNPEQLLQHFDRISEAPDAIPRLRRFILDLAVRGKLVEQDPIDEPAVELLKRIQVKKMQLLNAGIANKERSGGQLITDELPFPVPKSWQWSQLAAIGFISPRNDADGTTLASFVINRLRLHQVQWLSCRCLLLILVFDHSVLPNFLAFMSSKTLWTWLWDRCA